MELLISIGFIFIGVLALEMFGRYWADVSIFKSFYKNK